MAETGGRGRAGLKRGRRRRALTAAVLVFAGTGSGIACSSSDATVPDVAARVGSAAIPSGEVEQLAARFMSAGTVDAERPPIPIDEARRVVLNFLVRSSLLKTLAVDAAVEPVPSDVIEAAIAALSAEELAQSNLRPEDLHASIEAGELSKRLAAKQFPNVAVSDFELQELYDKAASRYAAGWSAEVRVAFLPTLEASTELSQLPSTPDDFEAAANALGATRVGSMGTVSNSDALGDNVLAAVAALPVGELSAPVEATGGWLVFLVDSRQDVPLTTFDQARPELLTELEDQKRQVLFVEWFDAQLKETEVTIDEFYGTWSVEGGDVEP
jgi:hypothetical protein